MMSATEAHWEPLAQIYLSHPAVKEKKKGIYCLCSRVFIKNCYDVYASTLERGESVSMITSMDAPAGGTEQEVRAGVDTVGSDGTAKPSPDVENLDVVDRAEVDDVFSEEPLTKQLSFGRDSGSRKLIGKWERDGGASDASCYFSASASHSDTNYCSTDEHEHMHMYASGSQQGQQPTGVATTGLHSSDSGADISERNFERKFSVKDKASDSGGDRSSMALECKSSIAIVERNNSLPEVFGREDLHEAWETYWSKHGEGIIWASWIEKYSDYINPEYLGQDQATGANTPHSKSEATPGTAADEGKSFSFEQHAIVDGRSSTEIIVSACSPHPYSKPSHHSHWPISGDDIWNAHRSGSGENDALLSPRCDSVTSSIPLTIGTTDSMTNVTRMTISSYDFCSSKVSSESSNLSDSLSSEVSSAISSNSSELLETEYLVGGPLSVPPDEEAAMDGEQYWQILWQQHFQELYATHYHRFMATHANDEGEHNFKYQKRKRNSSGESSAIMQSDLLPDMVAHLKLEKADSCSGGEKAPQDGNDKDSKESKEKENDNVCLPEDLSSALEAFGLPTAFGKAKNATPSGGDRPPNDKPVNLKRSHESDTEETPKERLKAAFELMGYAFSDPANNTESIINITGDVVYRKKHIRLHNRVLKMKHHKPKHTYYDDDGNEISAPGGGDKTEQAAPEALMHTSSDDDETNVVTISGRSNVRSSSILDYSQLQSRELESLGSVDGGGEKQSDEHYGEEDCPDVVPEQTSPLPAASKKEKKKKRKPKFVASLPAEIANDKSLLKYWYKRFSLFSLFDSGIRLDRESWFSVTPEKVAAHTAERCRSDMIVDAFCGCGGNAIQFAFTCTKVIAIDIDPRKIEMAKHNATVYGVADRIEFITGDFLQLAESLRADVVFLSPPWGGPNYLKDEVYDLENSLLPVPATALMAQATKISKNVAIYLPRNSNTQQLTILAGPNGAVEIEQNFLDRKLIALTAYYGDLLNE